MSGAAGRDRWLVVTGISGSGRTTALHALEDLGWYCIDNLPPALLPHLRDTLRTSSYRGVAIGLDVRTADTPGSFEQAFDNLRAGGVDLTLVYLDCSDEVLVRRFGETRRRHPLLNAGSIPAAIAAERHQMMAMRVRTTLVIDTSALNVHQLKAQIADLFGTSQTDRTQLRVNLLSFGFKHGSPRDADWIFDVRGLLNPHFVPALRPRSGSDHDVASYVLESDDGAALLAQLLSTLRLALPMHRREGRVLVTVAIGCTGGRHRSVAIAEALAAALGSDGEDLISVHHRDRDNLRISQ